MQKKIIALAIAGLSTAAFAQSNVTISGQMRVGYDNVSATGATAGSAADLTSRFRVVDNNSNIRFAGTEKLGNGWEAWWQVESAIGSSDNVGTTGAQPNNAAAASTVIGTRNTAVGLRGDWGSFLIGKWDTHYSSHAGADANGLAPHSLALTTNSLNLLHTANGANGAGGRYNNTMQYWSPSMSGFAVKLGYSTAAVSETTTAASDRETNIWVNPTYNNGGLHLFLSYLGRKDIAAATGVDAKFTRLGGSYATPWGVKIGAIWDKNSAFAANVETKRTAWALPVSYTMGSHAFALTFAGANDTIAAGTTTPNTAATMLMLGYGYSFSKRTSLGISYTTIQNDSAAVYDGWHPSSSVGAQSATGLPAGSDPKTFAFNLNHTF